jgi:hypothetical protein
MPVLLLLLFSMALTICATAVVFVNHHARRRRLIPPQNADTQASAPADSSVPHLLVCRPGCWLAIKSRSLRTVQAALGLHNAKPCSFIEGMSGGEKLFIAPPINGWILVLGVGLPEPSEDVDACFRFMVNLSRKLGEVQFFSASRVVQEHAWVRAYRGRVVRAYAWAGKTLWKQGRRTAAETELDLKCFDYTETPERNSFTEPDVIATNVDKVPLLAARWSLDPACIDERLLEQERGIAGEPLRRY